MAQVEINIETREETGKGAARKLRANGQVPAVVYGKGFEPIAAVVDPKDVENIIYSDAGWNALITLKGKGALNNKVVVLKDADFHPLRRDIQCVDFHVINLKEKSLFMVPVSTVGTAAGQKIGGTLQLIRHELEVECLPSDVPQGIEIDVTALEIGDTVHVEEINVPEGVELVYDVNFTVVTVVGQKPEETETTEDEDVEAETEEGSAE